jgi:predicted nucleic acid-binding protein
VTLVDSNVLIDIFGRNPQWWPWSLARVQHALRVGPVLINDIVYAETSIRFQSIEEFERRSPHLARLSRQCRAWLCLSPVKPLRGTEVLPDFFIGAHATVERLPLLTRDARRYRHYFPTVALIAPNGEI